MKFSPRSRGGRILLTAITLGAIGAAGVLTTQATFTDQVTMAQISVTGGTLDVKANGGNGPLQSWTGTINTTGWKPGDEQSATVDVSNAGTLPMGLTASTTGSDTPGCFGYYFRETSNSSGATKNSTFPGQVAGMGTAAGGDGTVAAFATAVTNATVYDVSTTDSQWETDDVKTFTLTVRMKSACTTQGSTGTLNFTLNATQV